jgi:hypothetical protein
LPEPKLLVGARCLPFGQHITLGTENESFMSRISIALTDSVADCLLQKRGAAEAAPKLVEISTAPCPRGYACPCAKERARSLELEP